MNQSERRQYLIRELIAEDKEYQRLAIPKDEGGQKVLLRAMMNVRAPKPCGEEFLTRISKNSPTSIGGEMNCYLLHSAIVGM